MERLWYMDWRREWKALAVIVAGVFAFFFFSPGNRRGLKDPPGEGFFYYLPLETGRFQSALQEALYLTKWYAQEHVILCLVPAFFIAGAIAVFVSQASVIRYFGARANKALSYGVGSISGTILAVCSCTVLPPFAGIYRMGAGLGPA